jgi:nicotinamide-nucleotide amidase
MGIVRTTDTATLAETLIRLLKERDITLCVAESLTGGMLSSEIVGVPGASEVYKGGIVTYATSMKSALLGVSEELIATNSPVDSNVAEAMASGALKMFDADIALATTGVAGPDTQDGKPVGLVYVSAAHIHRQSVIRVRTREYKFSGSRQAIRLDACLGALELAIEVLE